MASSSYLTWLCRTCWRNYWAPEFRPVAPPACAQCPDCHGVNFDPFKPTPEFRFQMDRIASLGQEVTGLRRAIESIAHREGIDLG